MEECSFFLVWSPAGRTPPGYKHLTYRDAEVEAKRLAGKTPGETFFVLEAVSMARTLEPVSVTRLRSIFDDEGIPF